MQRIGLDIVPVSRIRRSLGSYREAFLRRVLTEEESNHCQGLREAEQVAGRVAAKEAVMKVLGDGWPRVPWTSIEVLADSLGRPKVRLHGKALELFLNLGLSDIDVSITHDAGLAIAVAVAAGNPCREG
ncbi:MAG: holo-ACP synthase [Bacillota bacterium]|jgi:holo-[acyl-carrier protein] synthase